MPEKTKPELLVEQTTEKSGMHSLVERMLAGSVAYVVDIVVEALIESMLETTKLVELLCDYYL